MSCNSHNPLDADPPCTAHTGVCLTYYGYVPARTISFTNEIVNDGEIIELEFEWNELLGELNDEATRRTNAGLPPSSIGNVLINNIVLASEIRQVRDLFLLIVDHGAQYPYTDTEISLSTVIDDITVQEMKDQLISDVAVCVCDCNYDCTCHCNYDCTCDCHFCTCDCDYCACDSYTPCGCDCNYVDGGNQW